jgi:hypothetical protein
MRVSVPPGLRALKTMYDTMSGSGFWVHRRRTSPLPPPVIAVTPTTRCGAGFDDGGSLGLEALGRGVAGACVSVGDAVGDAVGIAVAVDVGERSGCDSGTSEGAHDMRVVTMTTTAALLTPRRFIAPCFFVKTGPARAEGPDPSDAMTPRG